MRYELLLLAELGFGLDLERCAASGDTEDLIAVSPRSGRAVSAAEAEPYLGKLLPLPAFLREGGRAGWDDILEQAQGARGEDPYGERAAFVQLIRAAAGMPVQTRP